MGALRPRVPKLAPMGIFGTIVVNMFCSEHDRKDVSDSDDIRRRDSARVAHVDLSGEFELYVVVSIAFPPSCSYLFHPYLSLFYSHLSQFVDILLLVRLIE
jgi:hypothetical protein